MRIFRALAAVLRRIVPGRYTSRRDGLTLEQDQLTTQNSFRSGM